jgi:predicted dehydrogenase
MGTAPTKVGIVGVGVGRLHAYGYQQLADQAEVVAACDVNEARLHEISDEFKIPHRFTDFHELFKSGLVEAVSICLPNNLHAPVSIAGLEAGLHVLCEKPLADNLEAGQRLVAAAAKASSKFMICFNRRYRRDIQWMKQMVDGGELGQVYQIRAGWVRETGIPAGWFTDKFIAGGGPLIDLGVHMLDAVMWLLDYPAPLTVSGDVQSHFGPTGAKTWHRWRGGNTPLAHFTVEDSASAFIRLAGKRSLFLETSWASHEKPGLDDFYISLYGTAGTLKLYVANYAPDNTLTFYREINGTPVVTSPAIKGARTDHEYAVAEFIRCIREGTPPSATAGQGQTILTIIDAIYRSAEAGGEVVVGS